VSKHWSAFTSEHMHARHSLSLTVRAAAALSSSFISYIIHLDKCISSFYDLIPILIYNSWLAWNNSNRFCLLRDRLAFFFCSEIGFVSMAPAPLSFNYCVIINTSADGVFTRADRPWPFFPLKTNKSRTSYCRVKTLSWAPRLDIGECMNYGTDNVSIGLPRNSSRERPAPLILVALDETKIMLVWLFC